MNPYMNRIKYEVREHRKTRGKRTRTDRLSQYSCVMLETANNKRTFPLKGKKGVQDKDLYGLKLLNCFITKAVLEMDCTRIHEVCLSQMQSFK